MVISGPEQTRGGPAGEGLPISHSGKHQARASAREQPSSSITRRVQEVWCSLLRLQLLVFGSVLLSTFPNSSAWAQDGGWLEYRHLWDPEGPNLEDWQALGRGTATFPGMMCWGEPGELLLIDAGKAQILRLTRKGELLQVIGGRGQGPGEFTKPVALDYDEDAKSLWVADGTFRYSRFTLEDGQFVFRDSFTSPNTWGGMRPILIVESGDQFWGTGRTLGPVRSIEDAMGKGRIKLVDVRRGIVREFGPFWEVVEGSDWNIIDPRLRNSGFMYQLRNGNLIWVWLYRPIIEVWDREGRLLKSHVFEEFPVMPPRRTSTYTSVAPTVMAAVIIDEERNLLFITPPRRNDEEAGKVRFVGLDPETFEVKEQYYLRVPGVSEDTEPVEKFGGLELPSWDDVVVAPVLYLAERIDGVIRFYGVDILTLTPIVLYPTTYK